MLILSDYPFRGHFNHLYPAPVLRVTQAHQSVQTSSTLATITVSSQEWSKRISKYIKGKTIHDADLSSASKFDLDQFLLFRVLWKRYDDPRKVHNMLDMKDSVDRTIELLLRCQSWFRYCDSFGPKSNIPEGTFTIARHYQLEVAKTQNKANALAFSKSISSAFTINRADITTGAFMYLKADMRCS